MASSTHEVLVRSVLGRSEPLAPDVLQVRKEVHLHDLLSVVMAVKKSLNDSQNQNTYVMVGTHTQLNKYNLTTFKNRSFALSFHVIWSIQGNH